MRWITSNLDNIKQLINFNSNVYKHKRPHYTGDLLLNPGFNRNTANLILRNIGVIRTKGRPSQYSNKKPKEIRKMFSGNHRPKLTPLQHLDTASASALRSREASGRTDSGTVQVISINTVPRSSGPFCDTI